MRKYGPKDTCWAANWGEKDESLLRKYFTKSENIKSSIMIIEFFHQLEQKWNDHRGILEIDGQKFEIIDLAKTEDLPTVQGLQYCCLQIVKAGLSKWQYHGVGNSTLEPRAYQQRLYGETTPRADMLAGGAQGSISAPGNRSMLFTGIFAASFPTITVRESAVFTNSTGYTSGIMLNRQVFSAYPITHTVSVAPFTVATKLDWTPVTTYG